MLSSFERRTLAIGFWGVVVSALSLFAASLAGYFVFQQFKEMAAQTDLAGRAARQARSDAMESGKATAIQIDKLQAQIDQQKASVNLTERAYVAPFGGEFRYANDPKDKSIGRVESMIYVRNSGHSPADGVHIWRCNRVLNSLPDMKFTRGGENCVESNLGSIGSDAQLNLETADLVDIVRADSLPTSVFAKGQHYYVWGRITYKTLSKDKIHFTSFCLLNAAAKALSPCSEGNDGN